MTVTLVRAIILLTLATLTVSFATRESSHGIETEDRAGVEIVAVHSPKYVSSYDKAPYFTQEAHTVTHSRMLEVLRLQGLGFIGF